MEKSRMWYNLGLLKMKTLLPKNSELQALVFENPELSALIQSAVDLSVADKTETLQAQSEPDDLFGAYVLFERAYQTLIKGGEGDEGVK